MTRRIPNLLSALALTGALALTAPPALAQQATTVPLAPLGGSAVRGTLTVEPAVGGISTLLVEPTGLDPKARYDAFLHAGTCALPSASAARLMGVLAVGADGRGRLLTAHAVGTGAGVAFELTPELLADGDHLVIVRDEAGGALACGAIPRAATAPTRLPRTGAPAPAALAALGLVFLALGRRTLGGR